MRDERLCVLCQVAEFLAGRWTWADARKFLMREGSVSASGSSVRASPYMAPSIMNPQDAAKLAEVRPPPSRTRGPTWQLVGGFLLHRHLCLCTHTPPCYRPGPLLEYIYDPIYSEAPNIL